VSTLRLEDPLLTAKEVAQRMRVNPRTVAKWARTGKITAVRTFGGHYRFKTSEINKIMSNEAIVTARPEDGGDDD
jgi:excisionase family DNA binding protein